MSDLYSEGIEIITDVSVNDSDKILTPEGSLAHKLLSLSVHFVSTVSAGDRLLRLEVRDAATNVISRFDTGVEQTNSLTVGYNFIPGGTSDQSRSSIALTVNIAIAPEVIVPVGGSIRVYDRAAIDAAADDMEVRAVFENLSRLN